MLLLELLPRVNCIRSTSFPRSSTNVLQKQWRARLRKLHIKRAWPVASVWRKTANRHFSLVACHEIKLKARDAAGILARRSSCPQHSKSRFLCWREMFCQKATYCREGQSLLLLEPMSSSQKMLTDEGERTTLRTFLQAQTFKNAPLNLGDYLFSPDTNRPPRVLRSTSGALN